MNRLKLIFCILFALCGLSNAQTGQTTAVVLDSFTTGQVSPKLEARQDFPKYNSACRTLENFLISPLGPVQRRPGTKYIATAKSGTPRLIKFEYSTDDVYCIEMGNHYMRFYRNGGQILESGGYAAWVTSTAYTVGALVTNESSYYRCLTAHTSGTFKTDLTSGYWETTAGATDLAYELYTEFDDDEIWDVRYAQNDNEMYLVDANDEPQILTRTGHAAWTITGIDCELGPFSDENEIESWTITPSATTGNITLESNRNTWDDPDHVGSLWRLTHHVDSNTITGNFTATGCKGLSGGVVLGSPVAEQLSSTLAVARNQDYTVVTSGLWHGILYIEKSYDNEATWETIYSFTSTGNNNLSYSSTETVDDAEYRLKMTNHLGVYIHRDEIYYSFSYTLTSVPYERQGIVEITAVTDFNDANATVLYDLGGTAATYKWAEGAWSAYRGWPETIAFHQQRVIFGGNESYPTTLWCSAVGDYNDLSAGALDSDGFAATIQGQNPIRWLLSGDYLIVGTSGGVGKFGYQGKALTPTSPGYIEQTQHGSAPIQAVMAGDTIIYVERNLRKIREFGYTLQYDRYTAPDLTLISEEITDPCVVEIAFQNRPWPILWCVLGDGNMATLCYHRDQMVAGWSQQTTDGNFASAIAMPGGGTTPKGDTWTEDVIWTAVERTVNSSTVRMIELFTPVTWGTDPNYCWFVDSALSGTAVGGDPNSWSGLSHLATETVSVYADLDARDDEVVSAAGVIDCNAAYTKIIAGLPFTSKMETLSLKMPPQIADLRISDRKVTMLDFDLYQSQYMEYGMGENATLMTYDPGSLKTDTISFSRLNFPFGSLKKPSIYIETSKPLPLCIRGIVPEITYYRPR